LELMHTLLPTATDFAVLVDPTSPTVTESFLSTIQAAAGALGLHLHVLDASTERDIDSVFPTVIQLKAAALILGPTSLYVGRSEQLAALSIRYRVPTIHAYRPFAAAGGLISYGSNETEYYRLVGIDTGRILKGAKPAELPVEQSTKVELIINLKTAKALGITVPLSLLGRADEVIE
jgi:putative tryptophan/tyrosine transport system substrate-binding protein